MEPQQHITYSVEEVRRHHVTENEFERVGDPNHSIKSSFYQGPDRKYFLRTNETAGAFTELMRTSLIAQPRVMDHDPCHVVMYASNHSVHRRVGMGRQYQKRFANPILAISFCNTYQILLEWNRGLNGAPNVEPAGDDDVSDVEPVGEDGASDTDPNEGLGDALGGDHDVADADPNEGLDDAIDDRSDGGDSSDEVEQPNSQTWPDFRMPGEEAAALMEDLNLGDDEEE
ncbi:predicted protein [Chaetoceros tenuissimus]|uniref:Uncharacterized protein n=1 Tax=Chaetoceros tenuissimus TaxID=426638 RepID=A0AAD3D5K0_9STRA|nr:predicted protein [Chaetoceros tenuissimus]